MMKKIQLLIFCILFIASSSVNVMAEEKWEAATARYTNYTYGFHWNLLSDLKWQKVQGSERHTVFAAYSPYGIYAFVNVRELPQELKNASSIVEYFDNYKQLELNGINRSAQLHGGRGELLQFISCKFAGKNAIFSLVKMTQNDDVVNETSYGLCYKFYKNGKIYMVNIKVSKDVWDELGLDGVKKLFTNFGPTYSK